MKCTRCHRMLRNPPTYIGGSAFGPTCAASLIGPRPKRRSAKTRAPDERQAELALEVAS